MISEWPPEAWAVAEKRKAALIKADSPEIDFSMIATHFHNWINWLMG